MKKEAIIEGTTKETHAFGREISNQLSNYTRLGKPRLGPKASDTLKKFFKEYLLIQAVQPGECKVLCLVCPKFNPKKKHHHWIVVDSTGFHSGFFDCMIAIVGSHREVSKDFIKGYFNFTEKDAGAWSEAFDIHFVKASKIGSGIQYWKDLIIQQHDSDLSFIRNAQYHFWEIDPGPYPQVGFKPVIPYKLFTEYRTVVTT